jgi:hypothetical protein
MRLSSSRERILCGFVAFAVLTPLAALSIYFMLTTSNYRPIPAFAALAGFGGGAVILGKIAVTGRSWRIVDLRVANVESSAAFRIVRDVLIAIGVNVVAFALSLISQSAPGLGLLVLLVPMGIFGMHCLFVGLYAYWQMRKGRRLRAVLAGCIALGFVIVMALNLRVA